MIVFELWSIYYKADFFYVSSYDYSGNDIKDKKNVIEYFFLPFHPPLPKKMDADDGLNIQDFKDFILIQTIKTKVSSRQP